MTQKTHHYIVGDIHGCLHELLELEQLAQAHASRHDASALIVSVGDLVDRGPHSRGVLEHLRAGVDAGTHAVVAGNHDAMMLEALEAYAPQGHKPALPAWCTAYADTHALGENRPARTLTLHEYSELKRLTWVGYGGAATLQSFGCDPHDTSTWKVDAWALEFVCSLGLVWSSADVMVTHALATDDALSTLDTAEADSPEYARAAQSILWNRAAPQTWSDSRVHVSGHTVVERPTWRKKGQMLQVDTGCVFGQRLTAWCPQTTSYLSVPSTVD